ncbi:hypothetical protein [Nitrosomonas communis]|uniref:Uncharacterized protein n=1 Tax=Nitrosomonas communis TaxID=44574 RepID=A0A1I4NAH8_9PROT|nr:hypothetical protein [Nitrosomonas communis]SFM12376.1 hypothetical protein SAMN05421863_10145 [Nitrosomonas communis]
MKTQLLRNWTRILISFGVTLVLTSTNFVFALEPGKAEVKFNYQYERPLALGEVSNKIYMVVPIYKSEHERMVAGKRKIESLRTALDIKMSNDQMIVKTDENKEIIRVKDERYRFKLYIPSGMVKFRDTRLYNELSDKDADRKVMTEDQARRWARNVLNKLISAKLIEEDQLLFDATRVSFRKERSAAGAQQGEKGKYAPSEMKLADVRVFVPRTINGLGVSGEGVNIVFDKSGRVAGLDLFWRDLRQERETLPLQLGMNDARNRFERSIKLPPGSQVNVIANDLVYFDPSKRDAVAFLEPAYIFVYVTRVPISDRRDEYRVSKVLHQIYPAVEHGREQIPSERKKRLQEIGKEYQMEHPEKAEPGKARENE